MRIGWKEKFEMQPEINDGGPAFPTNDNMSDGMFLRDYFAAHALAACIERCYRSESIAVISKEAYEIADAMLKAREAK